MNHANAISDEEWPMLGRDPGHSSFSPSDAPDEPIVEWIYKVDGVIESSPIVANKIVFIRCETGRLYAINVDLGNEIWNKTFDYGKEPVVFGNKVCLVDGNSVVVLFAQNGSFYRDLPPPTWNVPVYGNEKLFIKR
jgi:outer membrane protein assembly factor BamB